MLSSISDFIHEFLIPVRFDDQEKRFLTQIRSLSGKYTDFANILESYPDKKFVLLQMANAAFKSRMKESITSTQQALSLLGYIPSRNIVTASILDRHTAIPDLSEKKIKTILTYASRPSKGNSALNEVYFISGLVFDMARYSLLVSPVISDKEKIIPFLDELWNHGLALAKISSQLCKALAPAPESELEKALIVDALLHDIGKIFVPFFNSEPFYINSLKEPHLADHGWTQEVRSMGLSHSVLGHLFLWQLGFLPETSWVTLFHHQPFLATRMGRSYSIRATLLWLADHLLRYRQHHQTTSYHPDLLEGWSKAIQLTFEDCTTEQFHSLIKRLDFKV